MPSNMKMKKQRYSWCILHSKPLSSKGYGTPKVLTQKTNHFAMPRIPNEVDGNTMPTSQAGDTLVCEDEVQGMLHKNQSQCTGRMHPQSTKHQNRRSLPLLDQSRANLDQSPVAQLPCSSTAHPTEMSAQEGIGRNFKEDGLDLTTNSAGSTWRYGSSKAPKPKPNRKRIRITQKRGTHWFLGRIGRGEEAVGNMP